ncbi:MAG TPA: hypothetical protein VGQ87_00055 [Patescibacteria group bacterium]|jgi:hypothetical protein|nr:hypothetical protein [Patescibacteria group bacterium]
MVLNAMDIIRKVKPLKVSYDKLSLYHKIGITFLLISFSTVALPHKTFGALKPVPEVKKQETSLPALVFTLGDFKNYLKQVDQQATETYHGQQVQKQMDRQKLLAEKLENYLADYNSPLKDYAATLIKLKNWKQIVALSNAESSLCRNYPVKTANCWGVGGSSLWDFGNNLDEGVRSMNKFLENYPKKSKIKYSQMNFDQMNGLYKQPAKEHWVVNNEVVYDDLVKLEQSL